MKSHIQRQQNRRGMALILAMLCLAVSAVLLMNLTHTLRLERQNRATHHNAMQADWLARYGMSYAIRRANNDPTYNGETLEVSLPQVMTMTPATTESHSGRVSITFQHSDASPTADITIKAEFPADQPHQATRILTKSLSVASPVAPPTSE